MNFLTELLNRFRYRRGRVIDAYYAMGHGPQVEIMENDLAANGVIRWRIVRSCGLTVERGSVKSKLELPKNFAAESPNLKLAGQTWPSSARH